MMGQTANQDRLFYEFNLEEHIPRDHLLRGINRFLDLSTLRQHLAPFYSHTGRTSRVIGDWIGFYNHQRPHQALGMKTPAEAYALAA